MKIIFVWWLLKIVTKKWKIPKRKKIGFDNVSHYKIKERRWKKVIKYSHSICDFFGEFTKSLNLYFCLIWMFKQRKKRFWSSHPRVICEKSVLTNFAKFTDLQIYLKRDSSTGVLKICEFFCEFCEISKNTIFYRTLLVAAFEGSKENS